MNIDLHIHSTASDGSHTPSEILRLAEKLDLGAIALTDHDTIAGLLQTRPIVRHGALQILSGVELSAAPPPGFGIRGSIHILGYCFDPTDSLLRKTLHRYQLARQNRNPAIIERLNQLGIPLTLDDVRAVCRTDQLSRPHIAQALVHGGVVDSFDDAFTQLLGSGKSAYVDKERIASSEAIAMLIKAGGIPVLAHPCLIETSDDQSIEALIVILRKMGLAGLEVYYPEHSPEQTAAYQNMAHRHNLLMTGGTDFHGDINPHIQMGSGTGDFKVPPTVLEHLLRQLDTNA